MICEVVNCYIKTSGGISDQWRIGFPAVAFPGLNIREAEMRATVGGSDQCNGGTASTDIGGTASVAFNNNTTDNWPNLGAATSAGYLQYTFASPVSVGELMIHFSNTTRPASITLSYYNGSTYTQTMNYSNPGWSANTAYTFTPNV